MNLSKRQQLLAFAAIAALAVLLGDRLIFSPLLAAWKDRATRIATLQRSVNQGNLLLDRENSIRSRWTTMRTNTLAPEVSKAENQTLSAFDRWSQESRIGINSIKPQWRRYDQEYATLECRVDAFGSLPALTRFLYDIETSPMALKIDSVEITSRDDRGDQLTLGLHISGLQLNPADIP
ncbi:MAG: hypothetical protein JXQ71_14160 [Verrucomicrobia bacterium]|nr:hypothetical protein [Verrucomicrobiota bacterium]